MAEITVTVCDVCLDRSKPVRHYTLGRDGETAERDLCSDDSAQLDEWFPVKVVKRRRTTAFADRVKTPEEVAALRK